MQLELARVHFFPAIHSASGASLAPKSRDKKGTFWKQIAQLQAKSRAWPAQLETDDGAATMNIIIIITGGGGGCGCGCRGSVGGALGPLAASSSGRLAVIDLAPEPKPRTALT